MNSFSTRPGLCYTFISHRRPSVERGAGGAGLLAINAPRKKSFSPLTGRGLGRVVSRERPGRRGEREREPRPIAGEAPLIGTCRRLVRRASRLQEGESRRWRWRRQRRRRRTRRRWRSARVLHTPLHLLVNPINQRHRGLSLPGGARARGRPRTPETKAPTISLAPLTMPSDLLLSLPRLLHLALLTFFYTPSYPYFFPLRHSAGFLGAFLRGAAGAAALLYDSSTSLCFFLSGLADFYLSPGSGPPNHLSILSNKARLCRILYS